MYLFFDTETTGLPNKRSPDPARQPHIIQLAISLYDWNRRPIYEVSFLVRPHTSFAMPAAAEAVHGISVGMIEQYGVKSETALGALSYAADRAEVCIAHNLQFDQKLVGFTQERVAGFNNFFAGRSVFCTMEATKPILKLPPTEKMRQYGHADFKQPKLSEAYEYFFKEKLSGAHDALVDTRACARIFFELQDRKLV